MRITDSTKTIRQALRPALRHLPRPHSWPEEREASDFVHGRNDNGSIKVPVSPFARESFPGGIDRCGTAEAPERGCTQFQAAVFST